MGETWSPRDGAEVVDAVRQALASERAFELIGAGTQRGFGRPVAADLTLDLSALSGVVDYDPEELVITLRPATPLAEVEALLASRRQQLAFEPPDWGPLWGGSPRAGTIGGTVMVGRGGPRRISAGAPRDHCLGVKGVNGFGDAFASGGRVIKNVTGYDLPKLVAGSFGTLAVVTELTLKVLPAAPETTTLALWGLAPEEAVRVLSDALGSPAEVSAAAHLPPEVARDSSVADVADAGGSATLIRLEGVGPSVQARAAHLAQVVEGVGPWSRLDREASLALWKEIGDVAFFADHQAAVVWTVSLPPTAGPAVAARIGEGLPSRSYFDWGGGRLWLELPPAPDTHAGRVRGALESVVGADGHATLVRAPEAVRAAVAPFQPLAPALAALTERIQRQFDPRRLFNPGRMYEM